MDVVNVHEAKTRLSQLLKQVEAGADVVIARGGTPIARLVPIGPAQLRPVGFVAAVIPDRFADPLPEQELERWE